jgi:hypothetical protein
VSTPDAYVILIGPTPDGHYGAWAPDLPGCIALGDTVEDTEREMRERHRPDNPAANSVAGKPPRLAFS